MRVEGEGGSVHGSQVFRELHLPYVGAQREHHRQETTLAIVWKRMKSMFFRAASHEVTSITVLKSCTSMHNLQQNPTSRVETHKKIIKQNKIKILSMHTQHRPISKWLVLLCKLDPSRPNKIDIERLFVLFGIFFVFPMSFSHRIIQGCSRYSRERAV